MAKATELPDLIGEFVQMAKDYLRQETIEPAKQLGRFTGFSLAAGGVFALAVLFLSIAGMRAIIEVLPSGKYAKYWEGLGYLLSALALAVVAGIVVYAGTRGGEDR